MKARVGIVAMSAVLAMVGCEGAHHAGSAGVAPASAGTQPTGVVTVAPTKQAAAGGVVVRAKNADANGIPDPFPASYTLPSGEVLTAANVQSPLPKDGLLSQQVGIHMTLTDNGDKTKLATFEWEEKGVGTTKRRVVLTGDTVVDFNGKLGTIYDITDKISHGAVVASVAKDGVYAVMLRFGHGLLQVTADELQMK